MSRADELDGLQQVAIHLDCECDADSILHTIREIQADLEICKEQKAGARELKPVAVKPLEWGPFENPVFAGPDVAVARFDHFGPLKYQVQRDPDAAGYIAYLAPVFGTLFWQSAGHKTIDHAKAAAQADYETRIRSALVSPDRALLDQVERWQPIETAPRDGAEILAWFPCCKLDDDGDLTDEPVDEEPFGGRAIVSWEGGCWREPDWLSASGDFFGDDFEYASEPTLWQPLPAPPALTILPEESKS